MPDAAEQTPPEGFTPFPDMAGFIATNGPFYWSLRDGRPAMGFFVAEKHLNPVGICHGGMMMALMDMAVGQAVIHKTGLTTFPASINMSYDFLAPGELGAWLESEVDFIHTTRRTGFASGLLIGADGPVLRASGICRLPSENHPRFGAGPRQGRIPMQES